MTATVTVGVLGKPFGVGGACYVRPDPDVEHEFAPGTRYEVGDREIEVASRHDHGSRVVLTFVGVNTRDGAEELRGAVLRVDRSHVALDDESLWADDVVGAEVFDDAGDLVGVVEGLADGPAHDYLVVARPDAGLVWIPAVDDLITIEAGKVCVSPIPGLLDPDQAQTAAPRRSGTRHPAG